MKKAIVLFIVMVLLCGCSQVTEQEKNTISTTTNIIEETTENTTTSTDQPTELEFVKKYQYDIIPDHRAAEEVATSIFKYAEKAEGSENYKVANVSITEDGDTWIILLSDGEYEQIVFAEVDFCNISIDRKTGKVISFFFRTAEEQDEINKQNGYGNYQKP